ncbi:type VI secretion system protein VasD [Pseudomonas sp. ok272]|uniref:type VI secretion system lipoprotein TssJ n=1 Tax=unclassified Pseudomonas TaxID=196821 RepID=UPI0008C76F0A|nr:MULTISPECIES: type VI secretion system lipoprotein TssJ [unclassified Pseudomonas]SEN26654.1 type VI secretion system protein VasD [Pseudomonas sp. ok272]SFN17329.1 type VI secretion system protein VasD [Pseudomonas sp. ok602]
MSRTVFNPLLLATFVVVLSGCGLTQTVADATTATTRSIFYKQVKTLRLDFSARAAANTDAADMNAMSVPTLLRVYQLRDRKAMERATYDSLLANDDQLLSADLLDKHAVVVKPEEGAQLNVPLDKDAQFVVVVALLRTPDIEANTWRLILARDELEPDQARTVWLGDNQLTLRTLAKD